MSEPLCETVTDYKVVMEPKYVTEIRAVQVTETRNETRYRTKKVYKTVPVTETKYRSKVVNVPQTETKTVNYSVLVPEKSEKTVELTESVPSWVEEPEEYTVRVPQLIEQPETYTVKVPQLQDQSFTYTVNVPQPIVEKRIRTVTNAVPVSKTRTIQVCVPKTTMQTVCKDYGHWEEQVVEVPAASSMAASSGGAVSYVSMGSSRRVGLLGRLLGRGSNNCCVQVCAPAPTCSACGSCCGGGCGAGAGGCGDSVAMGAGANGAGCTTTVVKKVWVPNVVNESVPVTTMSNESQVVHYTVYEQETTEVPYECTKIVYQPETRTGTKKVCVYVDEQRTRMRKVVNYTDEKRTRMRKKLVYNLVTKTETVPHISYRTEARTKEVSYTVNVPQYTMEAYETTRYDRVCEDQVEEYTVCVPYCVMKEQQVQVCKMVPRVIEQQANFCCDASGPACGCAAPACGCGS